ncbi:hypothetical protein DXG01_013325 [Tephrocybe rancida]|nr:hypothetical protein DXG01_013325 [Tephrocybe rancida]
MQCVENCLDPDPSKQVLYEQPVWQTLQMFRFLPVLYTWLATRHQASVHLPSDSEHDPHVDIKLGTSSQSLTGWKILLLWIPAICDLTGTTLMNVGLLYTPVSIYQMTRGALVLFVGVFSVIFLRRRLWLYQWVSLIIVMTGVGLVGYSGSLIKDAIKESVFPSLAAHVKSDLISDEPEATQVLVERYSVTPLVAVGFEGLFGALSIIMLFPFLSIPSVSKLTPFFDLPRGWHQMVDNSAVLYSGIAIACSIAFFNYFGLSVTRHFLFNNLISTPACLPGPPPASSPIRIIDEEEESDALLSSSVLDETAALPVDLGQSGFDVIPEGHHLNQPKPHPPPQTQT